GWRGVRCRARRPPTRPQARFQPARRARRPSAPGRPRRFPGRPRGPAPPPTRALSKPSPLLLNAASGPLLAGERLPPLARGEPVSGTEVPAKCGAQRSVELELAIGVGRCLARRGWDRRLLCRAEVEQERQLDAARVTRADLIGSTAVFGPGRFGLVRARLRRACFSRPGRSGETAKRTQGRELECRENHHASAAGNAAGT